MLGKEYECVLLEGKTKREFLKYKPDRILKQILCGKHPLSRYFIVLPYVVLDRWNNIVARALVTIYHCSEKAYIGYFESENNQEAVQELFDRIESDVKEYGIKRLVGPIDCSIFIGYRFKIGHDTSRKFVGEPSNPDYYPELWYGVGFKDKEVYYSNRLRAPENNDLDAKSIKRLNSSIERGYKFKRMSIISFEREFKGIYRIIKYAYRNFQEYSDLTFKEFKKMFGWFRVIVRYRSVILVYKGKELCGFTLCIPNYSKHKKLTRIIKERFKPSEYVVMHMGIAKGHRGLGGAMAEECRTMFSREETTSIEALIRRGNTSGAHYRKLIFERYEYKLLEKELA